MAHLRNACVRNHTKMLGGLIVEGLRKDHLPVCGRIAEGVQKHCKYCSAEGSRKDFYGLLFLHTSDNARDLLKLRKDRGRVYLVRRISWDHLYI